MNFRLAACFILAAALFNTLEAVMLRLLGTSLSMGQMILIRSGGQILIAALMGGMFTGRGLAMLVTRRIGGHLARGGLSTIAWWTYFMSFSSLDLPLATTLTFSSQLFVLMLGWPILGERITGERLAATLIGFAGVMIAAGLWSVSTIDPRVGYGLAGALLGAIMIMITRSLSATERTETILFYMGVAVFLSAIPQAVLDWRPIVWSDTSLLIAFAIIGTMGTLCMIEGYKRAEATALAPFPYARLVFATGFGWWLFADPIRPGTMVGAALIVVSNLLPWILRRWRGAA